MKKELIYRNQEAIELYNTNVAEAKPFVQKVLNEYNLLQTKTELTPSELAGLVFQVKQYQYDNDLIVVEDFIRTAMAAPVEKPNIEGVPISIEAFKQMINIPNIALFADAIKVMIPYLGSRIQPIEITCFVFNDGKVEVSEIETDKVFDSNSYYAETFGQIVYARMLKALVIALNNHYELLEVYARGTRQSPPKGISVRNNKYIIDHTEVIARGYLFDHQPKKELSNSSK